MVTPPSTSEASLGSPVAIRDTLPGDASRLVQLNNGAVPAVPEVSLDEMATLLKTSSWSIVAERDGQVVGFVICFDPGVDYDSENYRYFEGRYTSHFYIDRIVIDPRYRGMKLGATLYQEVFNRAQDQGHAQVTCEVNLEPPNPASIAFHRRLGFVDIDTQATKGGSVVVQLMAAPARHV